jgi:hypothetical protein
MEEPEMFKTIIAIAALSATTAAIASPTQMTDSQYLGAVRCQALMSSPALGKVDTAAISAVINKQSGGRVEAVLDRADDVRENTLRQASHTDASGRASLIAERDGACQAFASNGSGMASTSSQPSGAN